MKYKKHIATGVLAISLLVGGSNVFAATPRDLGIKDVQSIYQRQSKNNKSSKIRNKIKSNVVGTVGAVNSTGFAIEVKNIKTKTVSSVDVKTDALTLYSKNGVSATVSDLTVGQKVIIVGNLDKTTNVLTAKTVKIVTNKKNL